jgi:hypothetical protein
MRKLRPWGIRRADYATAFYPQKLALTMPTSGGRSVGIVRQGVINTCLQKLFPLFCYSTITPYSLHGPVKYAVFLTRQHTFTPLVLYREDWLTLRLVAD